jgi:hypothetical protein
VSTTKDTREVDGFENAAIAAEITEHGYLFNPDTPHLVRVIANPHWHPSMSATLTPDAARALAAHLTELADEADLRNLEAGA